MKRENFNVKETTKDDREKSVYRLVYTYVCYNNSFAFERELDCGSVFIAFFYR